MIIIARGPRNAPRSALERFVTTKLAKLALMLATSSEAIEWVGQFRRRRHAISRNLSKTDDSATSVGEEDRFALCSIAAAGRTRRLEVTANAASRRAQDEVLDLRRRQARAALQTYVPAQRPIAGARFLRVMLSEMPTPVAF